MRSSNWKLLMAPLGILFLFACSPNQYQQLKEYDDVYFTSADRQQAPKVVAKPVEVVPAANAQVISLENTSVRNVEPSLVDKYSSPTQEVTYFEQTEPKVSRASELNYDHFVSDYENSLLKYYELPIDWEENWSEASFDRLVRDDFYFAQAWYEQYYQGDSQRMDEYLNGNQGRLNNTISDFRTRVNFNLGWGWGLNMNNTFVGVGFGNPWAFNDPWMFGNPFAFNNSWRFNRFDPFFYDPFFDPWVSWGGIGWNRNRRLWRRGFNRWNNWGYNPVFINNNFIGASRGEIIAARTGRVATRGARLNSTSVTSVRSDALNGSVANRRSGRVASTSNSRITKSSVANASSARGSSTARSGTSSVRSSRSSVPNVSTSRSSRVRTDAYRFSDAQRTSRSSRSSSVSSGRTSSSGAVSSRDVRNRSSRFTRAAVSSSRSSGSSSRNSGLSFNRNSSSRSSSNVRTNRTSSRSSSSFSRGSSSRSSSSRSIGSSRSSSSRSSGGSVRSSSSSRSSGSSRSSSGSRSSGSSRSGRGN